MLRAAASGFGLACVLDDQTAPIDQDLKRLRKLWPNRRLPATGASHPAQATQNGGW